VTPPEVDPEPSTELVDLVFVLSDALRREGDALVRDFGLSSARWLIAGALSDGPLTAAAIARKRGLSRQAVRESAALLQRDGLVVREDNPADARAPLLGLTARGREVMEEVESVRRRWAEETDRLLTPDGWLATLDSLRRLVQHFRSRHHR
jgi:DNA-binding MarR family transcriptional regulator